MTTEQKAKAYDKALERAKTMIDDLRKGEDILSVPNLEEMFPELKESDDEKIRKEMIFYFEQEIPQCSIEEHKGYMRKFIAWLEKQGEQKETLCDKPEPKFKIGDWIVQKGLGIYKIVEICKSWYEVISYNDEIQYSIGFDKENDCHLWTIEDAKEGDVVVDKLDGTIGIFQSIGHHVFGGSYNDISYCFLHCRYADGFFYPNFKKGNTIDSIDLIPATKEQRELLFQEMKESRYEWDAEKKELKPISDIDRAKDSELQEVSYHIPEGFHAEIEGDEVIVKKSNWSENEIKMLDNLIIYLNRKKDLSEEIKITYIEWLKSLKNRLRG